MQQNSNTSKLHSDQTRRLNRRLDDFMVFRPRQRRQTLDICIQIDNNVIDRLKETVFLGVILDEHLS